MTENRVAIQTYVPESQSDVWTKEADEMDVSRSEYVRMMVQAGRRNFDLSGHKEPERSGTEMSDEDTEPLELESRVMTALDSKGPLSWEDLIEEISGSLETRLETTLDTLQSSNKIKYSGRHGGYTVVADE
jgi:hypothetical protein